MKKDRAVLDANVLYSFFLRDILISLFAAKIYEAKWTEQINGEWVEHLLENNPNIERAAINRTLGLMHRINPSPLVTDYEHLIADLELPDPKDRHVLAAAIASNANKIVTWNLKDFPDQILQGFGIAAQNPDDFAAGLIINDPEAIVGVLHDMRRRLNRPTMDVPGFFQALDKVNLKKTRRLLERYAAKL